MSVIHLGINRPISFYLSGPAPCPYLPDQVERKLFTHLDQGQDANTEINTTLTRAGFRRSHNVVYRPACDRCNACTPVRIPVNEFAPSKTFRRIQKSNADISISINTDKVTQEHYNLFIAYQKSRHADGDMAAMVYGEFEQMLTPRLVSGCLVEFRGADGRLMAAMAADYLEDGFSAVYSFFLPDEEKKSLGTFMILTLIAMAKERYLPYIYLGYWIAKSRKMSYKARFRPLQVLTASGWVVFDEAQFNK